MFKFLPILAGNALFFSSALYKSRQTASCEEKNESQVQKAVDELEDLFKEGRLPSDPEELQEYLQTRNQNPRKAPQFGMIMGPVKMLTHQMIFDGLKLDLSMGLSQSFQCVGSWHFPNTRTPSFGLTTVYVPSPTSYLDEDASVIHAKHDSSGRLDYSANFNLGSGWSVKTEGQFPNADINTAQTGFELMKHCYSSYYSYKYGGGMHTFSMMQTLFSNCFAGFETYYSPQMRGFMYAYAFKYALDNSNTFCAQYHPFLKKEALSLGFVSHPTKRVSLAGELKGNPQDGFTETTLAFRLRFASGLVSGSFNTSWVASSVFQHFIDPMVSVSFHTEVDFKKADTSTKFGVNLTFGGGM